MPASLRNSDGTHSRRVLRATGTQNHASVPIAQKLCYVGLGDGSHVPCIVLPMSPSTGPEEAKLNTQRIA